MPVKIVSNTHGSTSADQGTIKEQDVVKMKKDFKQEVGITAIPPRFGIIKKYSFYFSREQLEELLEHYKNKKNVANAIEVAISVQIRETMIKCKTDGKLYDESDCLSVIISMANKKTLKPKNDVNDYVLINGYQDTENKFLDPPCCPGSKPPPYNR
jgi:hypothetical protein